MYNDSKSILISRIGLLDKLARVSCPILLALPIDTKDLLYSFLLLLCCRRAYFANKISKTKTKPLLFCGGGSPQAVSLTVFSRFFFYFLYGLLVILTYLCWGKTPIYFAKARFKESFGRIK